MGTAPPAEGPALASKGDGGITRLGGRVVVEGEGVSCLPRLDALWGRDGDVRDGDSAAGDCHRGRSTACADDGILRGARCRAVLEAAWTCSVWARVGGCDGGARPFGEGAGSECITAGEVATALDVGAGDGAVL
jgi:hypothetical protein